MRVESIHCDVCMDVLDMSVPSRRGFRLQGGDKPSADLCSMPCLESYIASLAAETSV